MQQETQNPLDRAGDNIRSIGWIGLGAMGLKTAP